MVNDLPLQIDPELTATDGNAVTDTVNTLEFETQPTEGVTETE
jgi:hypothetical protein